MNHLCAHGSEAVKVLDAERTVEVSIVHGILLRWAMVRWGMKCSVCDWMAVLPWASPGIVW